LIFLLAMVLVAAWLVKRSGGMPSWRSGGSMKVVAALSVGPRERVLLIELGGQQWLLGVTPSAINNLHHFAEPIVAAGSAEDFSNKLRQLLPQGFGK
jgi:flagellar protein FliO/FliZ